MSTSAIARNYAETAYELASRQNATEKYGDLLALLGALYREEEEFRLFLETPRVPIDAKREALRSALGPEAPETFLRFLAVVLEKRRQAWLPAIADAYRGLLDEAAGRVHAVVSLAFQPDDRTRSEIRTGLERVLRKEVVPHYRLAPELLGGVRVRIGDRVMDGTLRRRLEDLRAEMARGARAANS